jgi:hypothetical protein
MNRSARCFPLGLDEGACPDKFPEHLGILIRGVGPRDIDAKKVGPHAVLLTNLLQGLDKPARWNGHE